MSEPTEDKIVRALEKSGYLFENDVATIIGNLGFHVETSWAYPDPDEGKSREIDVRAVKRVHYDEENKTQVFVELLVECKDSSAPMVFLERLKNDRERDIANPKEYVFQPGTFYKRLADGSVTRIEALTYLGIRNKHYYLREEKRATQFAKIVHKGGDWIANHEGVYDALILPQAKVFEYRKKQITQTQSWRTAWLFFPVVVLRDRLYAYDLSKEKRVLEQRGRISFVRHIESGSLKGFYLTDFITFDYLSDYICADIANFYEALLESLKENPKLFHAGVLT